MAFGRLSACALTNNCSMMRPCPRLRCGKSWDVSFSRYATSGRLPRAGSSPIGSRRRSSASSATAKAAAKLCGPASPAASPSQPRARPHRPCSRSKGGPPSPPPPPHHTPPPPRAYPRALWRTSSSGRDRELASASALLAAAQGGSRSPAHRLAVPGGTECRGPSPRRRCTRHRSCDRARPAAAGAGSATGRVVSLRDGGGRGGAAMCCSISGSSSLGSPQGQLGSASSPTGREARRSGSAATHRSGGTGERGNRPPPHGQHRQRRQRRQSLSRPAARGRTPPAPPDAQCTDPLHVVAGTWSQSAI